MLFWVGGWMVVGWVVVGWLVGWWLVVHVCAAIIWYLTVFLTGGPRVI